MDDPFRGLDPQPTFDQIANRIDVWLPKDVPLPYMQTVLSRLYLIQKAREKDLEFHIHVSATGAWSQPSKT